METNPASVTRSSSFRKRALEERKSLEMEVDSLPSKHERAPSETEMDFSSSPAKFPSITSSTGPSAMLDEIEQHFQRSLAQARSQSHGSTTHTSPTPSSHPHRQFIAAQSQHSSDNETHPSGTPITRPLTTSNSPKPEKSRTLSAKPLENEPHQIVLALNNHAVTSTRTLNPPKMSSSNDIKLSTSIANGVHTVNHSSHTLAKPVLQGSTTGLVTVPIQTSSVATFSSTSPSKGNIKSAQVHTIPTIASAGFTTPEGVIANLPGGAILSPGGTMISPQMVQQLLSQQALLQQQQQQQQQGILNSSTPITNPVRINVNSSLPLAEAAVREKSTNITLQTTPGTRQESKITTVSSAGMHVIDLTRTEGQRSTKSVATPTNIVYTQKDGTPLVTMARASPLSPGIVGGAVRVVTPQNIAQVLQGQATSSTIVTATTTQPTPAVTSTLLTSQQVPPGVQSFSPVVVPSMFDPSTSHQLMTGAGGGSPVIFLSTSGTVPFVQQQPFFLVNPGDLSTLQQTQHGVNLVNPGVMGTGVVPNPGGGLILLSPGPGATTFAPPLINMGGANVSSTVQQLHVLPGSSSPLLAPTSRQQPTPKQTTHPTTATTPRQRIAPLANPPNRRTSLESMSPGADDNDDVMLTPASVEDHFAKALGEQWSKLQSQTNFNNHPQVVQPAQTQNTVAS